MKGRLPRGMHRPLKNSSCTPRCARTHRKHPSTTGSWLVRCEGWRAKRKISAVESAPTLRHASKTCRHTAVYRKYTCTDKCKQRVICVTSIVRENIFNHMTVFILSGSMIRDRDRDTHVSCRTSKIQPARSSPWIVVIAGQSRPDRAPCSLCSSVLDAHRVDRVRDSSYITKSVHIV